MSAVAARRRSGGIYRKLARSHLSLAALSVFVLTLAVYGVYHLQLRITRLSQSHIPATLAAEQLMVGVQRSLAGLHGWVGLGDSQMRRDWRAAWEQDIDPAARKLFLDQGAPTTVQSKIIDRLEDLRQSQWWASDVANTPGNHPARVLYQTEIEPIALAVQSYLDSLIAASFAVAPTGNRSSMLAPLLALQASFSRVDLLFIDILDEEYTDDVPRLLAALAELSRSLASMEPYRGDHDLATDGRVDLLISELSALTVIANTMIKVRELEGLNVAAEYMRTVTIPIAVELSQLSKALSTQASTLMQRDARTLQHLVNLLLIGLLALIVVSAVSAVAFARHRARDLSVPLVRLSDATKRYAQGDFRGAVSIDRDDEIGDLAGAFNTMRASLESVKHDLQETNQRLRARTEALAESNRELETYSASIAHDLRQPLRGIDGFSYLLLEECEGQLSGEAQSYLRRIRAGVQRIGVLMDEMLRLSQISRQSLSVQDVDLSALAKSVCGRLEATRTAGAVQWVIQSAVSASGDRILLGLVLNELLDNARKYSADQDHARVEFGCALDGNERVYFVRDNGIGIGDKATLFEPFQHVNTEGHEGTGSGLAAVARAVHRHGGRVWARSNAGQGATFFFTLGE